MICSKKNKSGEPLPYYQKSQYGKLTVVTNNKTKELLQNAFHFFSETYLLVGSITSLVHKTKYKSSVVLIVHIYCI